VYRGGGTPIQSKINTKYPHKHHHNTKIILLQIKKPTNNQTQLTNKTKNTHSLSSY